MNPMRPFVNWYNGRIVNFWIRSELQQRYNILRAERLSLEAHVKPPPKSVMDLAIESYINNHEGKDSACLDSGFAQSAAHQLRLFLFAGNDTTASTIVFAYHLLSKHPETLAKLREEHDSVFGKDPSAAASHLKENAFLLNKCKLTQAVIKETLRLYAPAATMRTGNPDCILTTEKGLSIPTSNFEILVPHHSIHRNPRLWPRPDEFLPERWLVGPEHELFPQQGAWRAFELGPRNCIGQMLAMNELRVLLIMTVRKFVISPAYEDFDKIQADRAGISQRLARVLGLGHKRPRRYHGERAYQTEKAGSHPSEAYPCYVSMRKTLSH